MSHYTIEQLRALNEHDAATLYNTRQGDLIKSVRHADYHTLKVDGQTHRNPSPLARLIAGGATKLEQP